MKIGVMILAVLASIPTVTIDNCHGHNITCIDSCFDHIVTCIDSCHDNDTNFTDSCYGPDIARYYKIKNEIDTVVRGRLNCSIYSNSHITMAAVWDKDVRILWVLVGIGGAITTILLIAVVTCIIFTAIVVKGSRFLIQYYSTSARANGEHDTERNQNQQQQPQNEVLGIQRRTGHHIPEPQYDSIENEQGPVHYFELEPPPQYISAKAKQQRKPMSRSHGAMAMSKLYSLPQLAAPKEPPGKKDKPPNVDAREQKQKISAVSLPPSITQYSGRHAEDPRLEKAKELVPTYSIPDKSQKTTKMILEPMEQNERETEQLSRSRTLDSFFYIKPQIMVNEGGDKSTQVGSSSPPPPLLPPKPRQKKKSTEDAGENEESVYAEASSKPLQVDSQRKTNDEWSVPTKTATVMSNISPFHLHAHHFQRKPEHFHQRSFSGVDHKKREETHSRLPTKTDHDQLDTPQALSLLESKEEEDDKTIC